MPPPITNPAMTAITGEPLGIAIAVPPTGETELRAIRGSGRWHLGHRTYPGTTATPHAGQTELVMWRQDTRVAPDRDFFVAG